DGGDGGDRRENDREEGRHEDQEDSRLIADAEPENGERYPGERREIAEEVNGREQRRPNPAPRAEPQADRDPEQDRQRKPDADPEQRRDQIIKEPPVAYLLLEGPDHAARGRKG